MGRKTLQNRGDRAEAASASTGVLVGIRPARLEAWRKQTVWRIAG